MTNRLTRAELLRRAALVSAAAATPGLFAGTARGGTRRLVRVQANGNKPPVIYKTAFTRRVATFKRVAYYPLGGKGNVAVAMVIDEILVGRTAANDHDVRALLNREAINTGLTVFGGLESKPSEDIQIWRLKKTPGNQDNPDVAMFIWKARKLLKTKKIQPEQVAPNHVLIPSSNPLFNYHTCPGGPPEETSPPGTLPPRAEQTVDVVVIDSGYVSEGPIVPLVDQLLERGQWFTATPNPQNPGSFTKPFIWTQEPDEPNGPTYVTVAGNRLAALVGHANFVAGVIAQACPGAQITLVNHNGGFIESDDADTPIPTEASVARSLWIHRQAAVINVGYAFATLPNAALLKNTVDRSGPPSWSFQLVLNQIKNSKRTVVVAPAGNQSSPTRQYPAAFHTTYPNVIGVGSKAPGPQRSWFSNYGSWVACCTEGENVLSTFITDWVKKQVEEPERNKTHPAKTFTSGWARWSGTSFAAPKVAAAIANRVGPTQSPLGAWGAITVGSPNGLGMGKILSGLPPTP